MVAILKQSTNQILGKEINMNIKDLVSEEEFKQFNEKNKLTVNDKKDIEYVYKHQLMPLKYLDVEHLQDMSFLFLNERDFNEDIGNWDVSSVMDMSSMFEGCHNFNQDLRDWLVWNVTDMDFMFDGCHEFNGDISKWKVWHVASMQRTFADCHNFNQDLRDWRLHDIENVMGTFDGCNIKQVYKPKPFQPRTKI